VPPQTPEPFLSAADPGRGKQGGLRGLLGRKQSMGNSVQFDSPAVSQLTKDINKLSEAMEDFKKKVSEVGRYLNNQGKNDFDTPISRMGGQFQNLKRDIDAAVKSANEAKNLYNNLGGTGTPTGAPASVGAGGGGGSSFTAPAPPRSSIVSSLAGRVGITGGGGDAGTGGGGGGGAAGLAAGAAGKGGKMGFGIQALEQVARAGINLVHDSASASILMADVLGPTATLAQTTIRTLIGSLAKNMAAYGSVSEQLSAINIGTQIGAGVPGGQTPPSTNVGNEIGKKIADSFWKWNSVRLGWDMAKGLAAGPFGGPSLDEIREGMKERAAAPGSEETLRKWQYGEGQLRSSSPEATKGMQQRTGGFYQGIREMQAITPGEGAGQIASQFADYISNTQAQQTGMILGQGAFTSFGAGAQIKSFSDWAKSILAFLKDQRVGSDRGRDFTYGELVSQNFPGSNINAWFNAMGVPQNLVFYWWQYAISQASKTEKDTPFDVTISQQRGDDLAAQRLTTLTYQGQADFGKSFAGGYSAALFGESAAQGMAKNTNRIKQEIMGFLTGMGVADVIESLSGFTGRGRAAGESVYKGMPVRTGELGPEVFVPKQDGKVMTASAVRNQAALLDQDAFMGNGGGGATFIFHTTLTMQGGGTQNIEAKRAAELLANHHEAEIRRRMSRKVG
jgi:hypothetical protein